MSLEGFEPRERASLTDLLVALSPSVQPTDLKMRASLWASLEDFEAKGALTVTVGPDEITLRVKGDSEPLALPRGVEFVKVCNDLLHPKTERLARMVRALFSPPRRQRPLAEVVQLPFKKRGAAP